LFQMDFVQQQERIASAPQQGPQQYRELGALLNDSPSLRVLRGAGYRIVAGLSAFSELGLMNADEQIFAPTLTRFEEQLLEQSLPAPLLRNWLAATHRSDVDRAIDSVANLAERRSQQPMFVFAHIFSPHPPFIFNRDGSARELPSCFPVRCALPEVRAAALGLSSREYGAALAEQIGHLNSLVVPAIDRIIAADPTGVIVVFSDHATRYDLNSDPSEANQNFFAARTPGRTAVFTQSQTTVNIFPRLLNVYLRTDLAVRPDMFWLSRSEPLDLTPLRPDS
jgi:hypothetical protein